MSENLCLLLIHIRALNCLFFHLNPIKKSLMHKLWALCSQSSPLNTKNHSKLAKFSNIFHPRAVSVWKTSSTFSHKGVVRKGSCRVHFPVEFNCACSWNVHAQNKLTTFDTCVSERESDWNFSHAFPTSQYCKQQQEHCFQIDNGMNEKESKVVAAEEGNVIALYRQRRRIMKAGLFIYCWLLMMMMLQQNWL